MTPYKTLKEQRQNLYEIIFYFKDMQQMVAREKWVYPPAALLARIGGILGMYTGFTAMTLFELVEFVISWILGHSAIIEDAKDEQVTEDTCEDKDHLSQLGSIAKLNLAAARFDG